MTDQSSATILELPLLPNGGLPEPVHKSGGRQLWSQLRGWAQATGVAEQERLVLWLPVVLAFGIGVYFALPAEPPFIVGLVLGAASLAGAKLMAQRLPRWVVPALCTFWLGFLAADMRTSLVAAPVLERDIGFVGVEGDVVWREPLDNGRIRIVLDGLEIERLTAEQTPRKIRVSLRGTEALPPVGARIGLVASLSPPGGPVAPGAYDFARVAWFQGIGAVGFGGGKVRIIAEPPNIARFMSEGFAGLRAHIQDRAHEVLPARQAAIVSALLVGVRGGIADEDVDAMRDAGLAHILAISGLHLGLVVGLAFFFVRGGLATIEPIALRWPLKKIAAGVAILVGAFYLGLSGGSVSTARAFLMMSVVMVAVLLDRPPLSLRTVAFAACIILLLLPESLMHPSFQMSFAAVTGLIAAYEWWHDRARNAPEGSKPMPRWAQYFAAVAGTTVVAEIATEPFGAFHFHQFQSFGLVANEVAVPVLAFVVMPLGVLSLLLMPFGLDAWPLKAMGWGADQILAAAHWASALPGAVRTLEAWPAWAMLGMVLGGLWLCLWRTRLRLVGALVAVVCLVCAVLSRGPDVFVAASGEDLAFRVKTNEGWHHGLIGVRASSYTGEMWLRGLGGDPEKPLGGKDHIQCDALGCVVTVGEGFKLNFIKDGRALWEECERSDVLITAQRIEQPCKKPILVLDRAALKATGPVALRMTKEGLVKMQTIKPPLGTRPWRHSSR